jgi:AAA family ATP:ADP antiporter
MALTEALLAALARPEIADEAGDALAQIGNTVVPEIARRLRDESESLDVRRELPTVLVRIGTPQAEQVLIESLLHADTTLRHRVIASLNKLSTVHPDVRIDSNTIEVLLAAEIAGHYRSYQVLGPLQRQLKQDDPVLQAMRHSMEQELERIFRLMNLLYTQEGLHDAYVGLRAPNPAIRANALEFLDNVLKPELRPLLVPLLDSHVSIEERIQIADRLVGAPVETAEQAIETLLASEDSWLRSCAVYAVGTLRLHGLEDVLRRFERSGDALMQETVRAARRRLAGEAEAPIPQEPAPADLGMGVGAG